MCLTEQGDTLVRTWRRDRDHGAAHLIADTSTADLATFVTVLDRILGNLRATYPTG